MTRCGTLVVAAVVAMLLGVSTASAHGGGHGGGGHGSAGHGGKHGGHGGGAGHGDWRHYRFYFDYPSHQWATKVGYALGDNRGA